jgi:hypothetical protein
MRHLALSVLLLLVGCPTPDETAEADGSPPTIPPLGSVDGGQAGAEAGAEAGADAGADAGEIIEGGAPEGAPLTPGVPPQIVSVPSTGEPSEGQVSISGILSYAGTKTGQYRIEFLQVSAGPPTMVHYEKIDGMGEWTVFAPINAGEIRIVSFIDQAGDGASSDDPGAVWPLPVIVGTEPITGIELVLEDEPDLGELAPKDHTDALNGAEVPGVDPPPSSEDEAPAAAP